MADMKSVMKAIGKVALGIGKVAAKEAVKNFVPGGSGIIQIAEAAIGAGKGQVKQELAVNLTHVLLSYMESTGRLATPMPSTDEIREEIQKHFNDMKAAGTLVEGVDLKGHGLLLINGEVHSVTKIDELEAVNAKVPG